MMKLIKKYRGQVTIHATWGRVQQALMDQDKAKCMCRRHVDMTGEANLLFTGAKAIHRGQGMWTVMGYAADSSDIDLALRKMSAP